jgi:hemerythrin-like domain-containing protein
MPPHLQPIAPSIDHPIELLLACHDKVRRFAELALKLAAHIEQDGPDEQAADAARSILRYFDLAAPLHHEDEDVDLFPALKALGHAELTHQIDTLSAEHDELGQQWQALRPWLIAITEGQLITPEVPVRVFAHRYQHHAQQEEALIYPWATQLSADQIAHISQAMVARRSTP